MRPAAILLAALILAGPALARESYEAKPGLIVPGGMILFFNSSGPLSYESLSGRELPPDVKDAGPQVTESCQYSLSVPISLSLSATSLSAAEGNGSFKKALQTLHKRRPELQGLYNVIVDMHRTSILGIFGRLCTEVHARGYR